METESSFIRLHSRLSIIQIQSQYFKLLWIFSHLDQDLVSKPTNENEEKAD